MMRSRILSSGAALAVALAAAAATAPARTACAVAGQDLTPTPAGPRRETAALVDMASGKILQKIPSSGAFHSRLGFSPDSRIAWVSGEARIAEYRING